MSVHLEDVFNFAGYSVTNPDEAKAFAKYLHRNQMMDDGSTPLITHIERVVSLVKQYSDDERVIALAWLHEALNKNIEGVSEILGLGKVPLTIVTWYMSLKAKAGLASWKDLAFELAHLNDNWGMCQFSIKDRGEIAYLINTLLTANHDVLLVRLCDMLANLQEYGEVSSDMVKCYDKVLQAIRLSHRKDLTQTHKKIMRQIGHTLKLIMVVSTKKEKLKEALRKHKLWLDNETGGERADLRFEELKGINLSGVDLRKANLFGADLQGANLRGADLDETNLWLTDLRGADLRGANITAKTLFELTKMDGAKMYQQDVDKAVLTEEQRESIAITD